MSVAQPVKDFHLRHASPETVKTALCALLRVHQDRALPDEVRAAAHEAAQTLRQAVRGVDS